MVWMKISMLSKAVPTSNNFLKSCGIAKWPKTYWQQLPPVLWHCEMTQNLLATTASSPVAMWSDPKPTGNNCLQSGGIVKWSKTYRQQLPPVLWHWEVIQNLLATIASSPVALRSDPKPIANNCLQSCGIVKWCKTDWQQLPPVLWHYEVIQNILTKLPPVLWHGEVIQNLLATIAFSPAK